MATTRTRKTTYLRISAPDAPRLGLDGSVLRRDKGGRFFLERDGATLEVDRYDAQLWADVNLPPADFVELFYQDRIPVRRVAICGPGTTARLDAIARHGGTDVSRTVASLVEEWIDRNEGDAWWSYRHEDHESSYDPAALETPVPSVTLAYPHALWEELRFSAGPVMNDTCRRLGAGRGYGAGDVITHMARVRCEELGLALDRGTALRLV